MATQRLRTTESYGRETADYETVGGERGETVKDENGMDGTPPPLSCEESDHHKISMRHRLRKDKRSIALLLLLYVLQGIPIGLAGSVPIILQTKKVGYRQQALFSLVSWPFTVKLLWAPVVDSLYSSRFGRRKSWLIPSQFCIGFTMIFLSYFVDRLMGDESKAPNVVLLTIIFFFLHFLAATQDIAVDGWALTMLSKENVGLASTCNSVGQTAGFLLSYTVFLAFNSADFCNSYIRAVPQDTGMADLPSFLFFFGMVFLVVTTGVWMFKKERQEEGHKRDDRVILTGYMHLLGVLKLPAVQTYALAILTSKVAFAAADSVTGLKLIEAGLSSEKIALIGIPLVPVQIMLPWIISRFTAGPRPMDVFMKVYMPRVVMGLVFALVVLWTSRVGNGGQFPYYYYFTIVVLYIAYQVFANSMFVAVMAFHARISDPVIGGTYMTLLNTITNMAGTWTSTLALWLVDNVSFKDCEGVTDVSLDCDTMQELKMCEAAGGHCVTHLDGYYVEIVVCMLFGFLWLLWQRKKILRLQGLPPAAWRVQQQQQQQL